MVNKFFLQIILFFFSLALAETVLSQSQIKGRNCPYWEEPKFNVYLSGYTDTIQPNGLKARIISAASLASGFELLCDDTLVKVEGYHLVFDSYNSTLYSKSTVGSKMRDDQPDIVPLRKIKEATLVTIDKIKVQYKGNCFMLSGQVYYTR